MPILSKSEVDLFFEVEGAGPPVLFIQGCGVLGAGWRPQISELSREFSCASFDNRGIGQSTFRKSTLSVEDMAQDGIALLDHLGWDQAHLVGHSLGGLIAQEIALRAPDRVRSLALLCTFARGSQGARLAPWTIWMGLRSSVGPRAMRRQAFLEMVMPPSYLKQVDGIALASTLGPYFGGDLADRPSIAMRQVRAMASHNAFERLPSLGAVPTLVVSAQFDRISLPRFGRMLADQIPGARHVEIADAAHGVTMQRPELVNALLREHWVGAERE